MSDPFEYLGAGIVVPFRRDGKQDFANSSGIDMIKSSTRIILGTLCSGPENEGEVRFNQRLGTLISTLRHRGVDDPTTQELATHYVYEGLKDNEPRIQVFELNFDKDANQNQIKIKISGRVTSETNTQGESSIFTEEVTI